MTQRTNPVDRVKYSHGTDQDEDKAIAQSLTPEVVMGGGVYRSSQPTYTANDNVVNHYNIAGELKTQMLPSTTGNIVVGKAKGAYTFDASSKTVTITGFETLNLEDVTMIINQTDNIVIFAEGIQGLGGTISGNVVTTTFDTTGMADADRLTIYVKNNAGIDFNLDSQKNVVQNPEWSKYTSPEQLVTASDIGASDGIYIDQGAEISTAGYNVIGMFVKFTASDSATNTIKVLLKHESGGAEEFVLETAGDYIKTLGDSNINIYYEFEINNGMPYIQIQSAAGDVDTGGGTIGTLEINIVKGWK